MIPGRRKRKPTPIILPGKSNGQRSLEGYSPRAAKKSDTTEQLNSKNNQRLSCTELSDSNLQALNHYSLGKSEQTSFFQVAWQRRYKVIASFQMDGRRVKQMLLTLARHSLSSCKDKDALDGESKPWDNRWYQVLQTHTWLKKNTFFIHIRILEETTW